MRDRSRDGWYVVAATFVMALFSFGLGFYSVSVYVATLQRLHGWSASTVSAPVTVYFVAGALLTASIAGLYGRFGPRLVVAVGAIAMAAGVAALGAVTRPWQLYPALIRPDSVAAEWPRERFAALVGLVVGINQLTFAFGPTLVGVVRDGTGTYGAALAACAALEAVAAVVILLRPAATAS